MPEENKVTYLRHLTHYSLETYQYVFRERYNYHHRGKLLELKIDQGFIIQLMIVVIIHILLC